MSTFRPPFRPLAFLLASICALSSLQAADPVRVATDSTVLVVVTCVRDVWAITGTHIYQANGTSAVFAVLPHQGGDQKRSKHETYQVGFRQGTGMRLLPAERIAWTSTHNWLLLRVKGTSLPPPPPLRPGDMPEAGAPLTLGCYAIPSFQPNAPPTPNIQRGAVSNILKWESISGEKARMLVVNRETGSDSMGGPVLDRQGQLAAFTGYKIRGTATSRTIPLAPVWRWIVRRGPRLDLGYARPVDGGWAVPCRVWNPLPTELQGKATVGIVRRTRDDRTRQHGKRKEIPGTVWCNPGNGGIFLLPVAPPERELRHYIASPKVKYRGRDPVSYPPCNLVVNYRVTTPASTPWLRLRRTKP